MKKKESDLTNFDVLDGFLTAVMLNEEIKIVEYYSMSPQERLIYDQYLDTIIIQNDVIDTASWKEE